jgi:phosphate:Na+ symporter
MVDLNITQLIFSLIGGLGLFIFGIHMMGDGLQKAAGQKMRSILGKLTKHRFVGLGLGTLVTAAIQSSSATTVMVVGFVNAGLMTLVQSIPIILGANIGTTITAQLIAFKLTDYTLPIVAIGAAMYLFGKTKRIKQIGEAILGFGILFLGLNIMSSGVKPLGNSELIRSAFTKLSHNPLLGILVGTVATIIVQSSSVSTGIVLALATTGLLDINAALPIILGTNIGTCVTAMLASIGANISARRTAIAHVLFNVIGTVIALVLFPFYLKIVLASSSDLLRQIANFHTIFNVVNALLFIGFVKQFAKIVQKVIPGKVETIEFGPKYLDKNLLNTPSIAIDAAKREIRRTLKLAKHMVRDALNAFYNDNREEIKNVMSKEDVVDELQTAITDYLVKITQKEISEKEAMMVPSLLHSINDIERIADHAVNIAEVAERKIDNKLKLGKTALAEIKKVDSIIDQMIKDAIEALPDLDKKLAKKIKENEEKVNQYVLEFRDKHTNRLSKGACSHKAGLIFIDLLMNFEKIGDHLVNVAEAIEGKLSWVHNH